MPSERRGTVTEDMAGFMRRLQGSEEWKGDKAGTIRTPIAKLNWPVEDVVKNVGFFLQSVKRATGNTKEAEAEMKRTGSIKPSTFLHFCSPSVVLMLWDSQRDHPCRPQLELWSRHPARCLSFRLAALNIIIVLVLIQAS
jgi:hypothetical protein